MNIPCVAVRTDIQHGLNSDQEINQAQTTITCIQYHTGILRKTLSTNPLQESLLCSLRWHGIMWSVLHEDVRVLDGRVSLEKCTEAFIQRVRVDVLEVLELPSCARGLLVAAALALLVLQANNVIKSPTRIRNVWEVKNRRTSILLFSRLASSKSLSRIPFATSFQSFLLSQSSCSSSDATVTSSLGHVTSVKSPAHAQCGAGTHASLRLAIRQRVQAAIEGHGVEGRRGSHSTYGLPSWTIAYL